MKAPYDLDAILADQFDPGAIARGAGYVRKGYVRVARWRSETVLEAEVRNQKGITYQQRITFSAPRSAADAGWIDGHCTCFMEFNCKHVAAALMIAAQGLPNRPEANDATNPDVARWMDRLTRVSAAQPALSNPEAAQKITLSPSRDIPFDNLLLSQSKVWRIKAGVSVEELAEDVARRGLLQSLSVRPVLDADGSETGKFEVPAGRRRFQALSLLVKQKRLAKTTPIPCIVRDAAFDILAEDDSLAENMQRVALQPLDQFRAFVSLRDKGQSAVEIAAAFFVTPQIVKQRLKLAAFAPALLEVYAEYDMTLEHLEAFTMNPDHARQVQVWDVINSSWNKEPFQIWRMLTETSVRVSDRRAIFVGVDAYEAGGGSMPHDLFQGDEMVAGWRTLPCSIGW